MSAVESFTVYDGLGTSRNDAIQAWFRANGLDPHPVHSRQTVVAGHGVVTYEVLDQDTAGRRIMKARGYRSHRVIAPITIMPSEYDLCSPAAAEAMAPVLVEEPAL